MVISLESQNVKIKRSFYSPKKRIKKLRLTKIEFNFMNIQTVENIININKIPYFVGIVIFSLIFSMGWDLQVSNNKVFIDIEKIVLPQDGADVASKDLIDDYDEYTTNDNFINARLYEGETISSLSIKYGVTKETILQYNNISDIQKFYKLNEIVIPMSNGYRHKINSKESLNSLSLKYDVPVNQIFKANNLKSENLSNFSSLFIPNIDPVKWGWHSNLDKYFVYPINGYVTKRYGFSTNNITNITTLYEGIDFAPINDLNVLASKSGVISRIGYSPNYGHYIYIDHTGGFRTLYAHLDNVEVSLRQFVKQGELIGIIGKSGFTNNIKLFFSVFYKDRAMNPEEYLN